MSRKAEQRCWKAFRDISRGGEESPTDWQQQSPAVPGPGLSSNHKAALGLQSRCLSRRAGPFTLRTGCVRRGQLHTLELSFIHLLPIFPPSPFRWLKILSKVENAPEKGSLRAGDCLPPWAGLALGRNTQTCPAHSQPGEPLSPAS